MLEVSVSLLHLDGTALRNCQGILHHSNQTQISSALQSFADVPITDDGVDTVTFLEASDGLVQMFGETYRMWTLVYSCH